MQVAGRDRHAAEWLRAAAEVEVGCDAEGSCVQVHLLCPAKVPGRKGGFEAFADGLRALGLPVRSMGASRLHVASGRGIEELAAWGAEGFAYKVGDESFWLTRGTFFQVNRFLLPALVELVCGAWTGRARVGFICRGGPICAWVGEAVHGCYRSRGKPGGDGELRRGLRRPGDPAVEATTLVFLREALVQRERPDLVVLDPPRAGAGAEVCELLTKLRPAEIVYVSCDPTTLARDLKVLSGAYRVAEVHMVDLFPQTYHLETVMVLRRTDVGG